MKTSNLQINENEIRTACERAERAFWDSIAEQYPQIRTGDLDIGMSVELTGMMQSAVGLWLETNDPLQRLGLDSERVSEIANGMSYAKHLVLNEPELPESDRAVRVWRAGDYFEDKGVSALTGERYCDDDCVLLDIGGVFVVYSGHMGDAYAQYPWHTVLGSAEPSGSAEVVIGEAVEYLKAENDIN